MEIILSYNGYLPKEYVAPIQSAILFQMGDSGYTLKGGSTKYRVSKNEERVVTYRVTNNEYQNQKIYVTVETA
jgi:hypothetical protein